jgi:hypothetical protein
MIKISVSNIVKYLRKSAKSRTTFLANLKKPIIKKEDDDTGGNYWMHSYSTISKVFKTEELNLLDLKIDVISEKKAKSKLDRSKNMYQKNIDILFGAKEFDYKELKPYFDVNYLKNSKVIMDISGVPIEISPNHVYEFEEGENKKVGAIWFVVIKDSYKDYELALFNYCLYHYLHQLYKDKYVISEKYCIILDVTNGKKMNYTVVLNNHQDKIKDELESLRKII